MHALPFVIEAPFNADALESRERLRPPFPEADELELWLERYVTPDGRTRHALLFRALGQSFGVDVELRSHGHDQTTSWDDRTKRGSMSHFFVRDDSVLRATAPGALPWRSSGTVLSCALSTTQRGAGMDRETVLSLDETIELTRDSTPFTRWRGVYRYVRYEDSAP